MAETINLTVQSNPPVGLTTEQARVIRAVSPTATVERIEGGAEVTITDYAGTTTAVIYDGAKGDPGEPGQPGAPGQPGQDGVSPTASVTQTATGATVTVTDAQGTTTATLTNGAPGQPGQDGAGVPAGGTAGQVLAKASGTDYDTEWTTPDPGGVTDVQVNGTSVVTNGVANVPMASASVAGVVRPDSDYGTQIVNARIAVVKAADDQMKAGTHQRRPIVPYNQHAAAFYGLAKAAGSDEKNSTLPVGQYTDAAKSAISTMLNGSVSVSGTTPTITALPGIRYVCGEVSTLDITLPASGCIDVVFQSGSTPTVLTITPPTGVTVKWAGGFDPTSLDANTTYEVNVCDGLGVAAAWT